MGTWLETIQKELETMDPKSMLEPNADVELNEHIVGQADDSLRRLYALFLRFAKTAKESAVAAEFVNESERQEHYLEQAGIHTARASALREIFWISLKDAFDLWQKPNVGIRRGWKVVWFESKRSPIVGLLGGFLGED